MASSNSKVNELTNRLTDPYASRSDPDEDEELFAQLEAEIENDDNAALRERGIEELKQEWGANLFIIVYFAELGLMLTFEQDGEIARHESYWTRSVWRVDGRERDHKAYCVSNFLDLWI